MQIVQTATATTIDMISNIGGTLGLFCGFSLLSGVEIVYWACRSLFPFLGSDGGGNVRKRQKNSK